METVPIHKRKNINKSQETQQNNLLWSGYKHWLTFCGMVVTGIPLPDSKELAKLHKLSNNSLYTLAHSTSLHIAGS
jgi:hypothetical protein